MTGSWPSSQRADFLRPLFFGKGGEDLVTYSDMFLFCTLIVSVISLMLQIYNSKKK
jgi:hypothetical protein